MANLTISVNDDLLKKARIRALEQGTSVNGVLREYLETYAKARPIREDKIDDLIKLSEASRARRGKSRWNRDQLHER